MSRREQSERSREAPMDYQWTNRSEVRPVWAAPDPSTPRKRSHDDLNSPSPSLSNLSQTPTFGSIQNVPFLFSQTSVAQTPCSHPWAPPPQFSPSKAFPSQEEVTDVDMSEISPLKYEERDTDQVRPVATGAMRRVYNQRVKSPGSKIYGRRRQEGDLDSDPGSGSENDEDNGSIVPIRRQNTSNHFTLNMPAHPAPQSDTPYILLGYLQFFFNLSLILLFLYLVVQFILTVQRDVELRISEYSSDIVQEIAMCALQFKNNLCATNPIPAMAQQCGSWEACMNRDPTVVGRAKVGAELIAEVVNGFVEPISWKTLIFTLTSLAFLTVFINTLLSLYRARHQPTPAVPSQPPPSFPIPATPFPAHHFGGYLSPAPTPNWGRYKSGQDLESPTRRRRLEGGGSVKIK